MSAYKAWEYNETDRTLTLGPGWRLSEIGQNCSKAGIFFPYGECFHVAAGGHFQTGGYSPLFTPSFGLFIDYALWIDIITADGQLRRVRKPGTYEESDEAKKAENDDLWFVILGGSPGNFGIVVQFQIRVLRDADYPDSRGLFEFFPFTKECLVDVLQLVQENNDNPMPPSYSLTGICMSSGGRHRHEIDAEMAREHHRIYGQPLGADFISGLLPATILVAALWTGAGDDTDTARRDAWFARIQQVMEKHKATGLSMPLYMITNKLMGITDSTVHYPLSTIAETACWKFVREFDLPLKKAVSPGTADDLKGRGFVQWAADRIWEIESDPTNGCKVCCQWLSWGGTASGLLTGQRANPTALGLGTTPTSTRVNEISFGVFYQTLIGNESWPIPKQTATEWLNKITEESYDNPTKGTTGKWTGEERRHLYAPWTSEDVPNVNLDDQWRLYFDDKAVYDRVLATKLKLDPSHVFTPNCFSVGFNDKIAKKAKRKADQISTL